MDTTFKALSDPSRRQILEILKKNDMTVNEIATHFLFTGPSLSHHLDILKRANLIISQREGQYIRYSLNTSVLEETLKTLINLFGKK